MPNTTDVRRELGSFGFRRVGTITVFPISIPTMHDKLSIVYNKIKRDLHDILVTFPKAFAEYLALNYSL